MRLMTTHSMGMMLLVMAAAGQALAQDPGDQASGNRGAGLPASRPRVSREALLAGRSPATSVSELQSVLERGHEVVVWDAAGRKTRGRLSSISSDQVVIHQRAASPLVRLFVPPTERAFPGDSVTRVDIVDSSWNGALIGAAIAPALVFGISRWEDASVSDTNSMKGIGTVVLGGLSAVAAVVIGQRIDLSINQPIYERPRGRRRVTLAPWLEPGRKGVVARVQF